MDIGVCRCAFTPAAAVSLLLACNVAIAQLPTIPGITPQKAEVAPRTEAAETSEQKQTRLRKLLDEAQQQSEHAPEAVPAGIDPSEVAQWRDAQLKLAVAYDIQLRALDQLERARADRQTSEASAKNWTSFDTPPPYSIIKVDELREALDLTRDRIALIEAGLAQLRLDGQRAQDDLRRSEEAVRLSEDALATSSTPEDRARATWRRDLARLKARAAGAASTAASLLAQFRTEQVAARRAESSLLERQIVLASQNATFTEADVDTVRKRVGDKLAEVRRELAAVEAGVGQRLRERDAAKDALARLRAKPRSSAPDLAAAQARLDAAEAWVGASRDQTDALRGLVLLGEEGSALASARYAALESKDAEARRTATIRLREAALRITRWKAYAESLVREARGRLAEIETRLSDAALPPAALRYEQDALAARRAALLAHERLENTLESTARQLGRWVSDLGEVRAQRDFRTRLIDAWLALRDTARRVWDFELFQVDDTTVVDGQSVTVQRGVTVGKSVGAILLFLLGYWAIAAIARRIEKGLVARGFDAPRLRTKKRWTVAFFGLLLAGLTLNLAHIPFTVFAFLGGALAIGVGFGTQTIIKNFVSGMLVLMERQVQVGDIIEVDNITGTVTEVNLRSSTVRGFDGVEAIIPNSVLIEHKVTNWTHSDRKVRRVLKIGVAYGSSTREVADLLQECAKRHGLVLHDPAPLVILEDFGDNALVFALYVWLELGANVNSAQVLSDLRFMIEKRFAEAGIVIAYPQRNIRLDAEKPLRIEVVRTEIERGEKP